MPKVMHIITGLNVGGAERSLHSLLQGAANLHLDHSVVSLTDKGAFAPRLETLGHPVHALGMRPGQVSVGGLYKLWQVVRRERPDIVQGWMYHGNAAALAARAMLRRKPALAWNIRHSLYDIKDEKRGTQAVIRFGRWRSDSTDAIIYNSNLSRQHHEGFGFHGENSITIANGFDPEIWCPDPHSRQRLRSELGIDAGARVIGFVGRFHKMKDPATFLSAMQITLRDHPDAHCVLVGRGNGPDNPELGPLYRQLPMDRVHLLGERSDVPRVMTVMDCLCLSSSSEAFPNVLGEAMATGVPCVSTDVGDARLIVGDTGYIVRPGAPSEMASAVAAVFALPEGDRQALSEKARARILDRFSLTATVDQYADLYRRLLGQYRS